VPESIVPDSCTSISEAAGRWFTLLPQPPMPSSARWLLPHQQRARPSHLRDSHATSCPYRKPDPLTNGAESDVTRKLIKALTEARVILTRLCRVPSVETRRIIVAHALREMERHAFEQFLRLRGRFVTVRRG
jgi:hypothetical protein